MQADIVQVVQEYVSLRKSGATYKGLCPFHSEKTPSFHVNRDKGFFHCFGCGAGGDVFKFLELQEKLGFVDAVRHLAAKFGMPIPEQVGGRESHADAAEREALLKVHERAAEYFKAQLATPAGRKAQRMLHDRGITAETIKRLGTGVRAALARRAEDRAGQGRASRCRCSSRSGLAVERDNGQTVDRFRGRLMIPIARDAGSIVAFGGRAMEKDQQPKYLNSPETPIYTKSRTLYGLNLTKADIRRLGYAVLVEGYFDFAQLVQAGIAPVVASCGTALTPSQAQLLRRFTSKVILSFDPDAAGQGAAARSCELLVAEGLRGERRDPAGRRRSGQLRPEARQGCLSRAAEELAAVPGVSARPRRRGTRPDAGRGPPAVPDGDAAGGGADSRPSGPRTIWRTSGPQGSYYSRGDPGGSPEGGRPEASELTARETSELRAGETGGKRADLGADSRARRGDGSPQRFAG